MNRCTTGLALAAAAWIAIAAAAAPAPEPSSQGPISDALALRGALPSTPPPTVGAAVAAEKGAVDLEVAVAIPVLREEVVTVPLPDGKTVEEKRAVASTVYETRTERHPADGIKFFTVGRDGKLEPVDSAKALGMLKQRTPVLTGRGSEVDPRNLELVRPGTLYLALPAPPLEAIPQPFAPPPGVKP